MSLKKSAGLFTAALNGMKAPQRFGKFMTGKGNMDVSVNIPVMLGAYGVYKSINAINNDMVRKALIQDLMDNDPVIKEVPRETVMEWYNTIYNVAPDISREKPLVKELLRNFATYGLVDLKTIKELADTQSSVSKSNSVWGDVAKMI